MSQFDGLADRTRVFPREPDAQYIDKLEVGELHFGGTVLRAIGGTRYANGRLEISGKLDNSIELKLKPGDLCLGRGVIAQILMFSALSALGWLRHCWSWNRGEDNNPESDHFVEDQGASGDRVCTPWTRNMGAKTFEVAGTSARTGKHYEYGEDDGGRDVDVLYRDGSDEFTLPDGRRMTYRSAFEAVVELCERNGIALEIR